MVDRESWNRVENGRRTLWVNREDGQVCIQEIPTPLSESDVYVAERSNPIGYIIPGPGQSVCYKAQDGIESSGSYPDASRAALALAERADELDAKQFDTAKTDDRPFNIW